MKKVAIITGSATGLGKQTAIALAKAGNQVVINYVHSQAAAEETAGLIQAKYEVDTLIVQGDMRQIDDVQRLVSETKARFGRIDILVHNAGPFIKEQKKLSEYDLSDWQSMIDGNLNSYFYLLHAVLPEMIKNQWGRIVMLGFEKVGNAPAWRYRSAYAASKSGAASLTRTVALEEAENGITVNMVCPGDIKGAFKEMTIKEAMQVPFEGKPRPGVGEDIARTIAFLCDEQSDYLTGSIIEVTGGKEVLAKRNQR